MSEHLDSTGRGMHAGTHWHHRRYGDVVVVHPPRPGTSVNVIDSKGIDRHPFPHELVEFLTGRE